MKNSVQKSLNYSWPSLKSLFFQLWVSVIGKQEIPFGIIHPQAFGIDVGSRSHMVAVDQVKENVREFGVCTIDHEQLIRHH